MRRPQAVNSIHLATCMLGLGLLCSCSPDTGPTLPEPARITKGPYLQNVTRDAITIMWETSQPTHGAVHYGVGGELSHQVTADDRAKIHEIRLTDLAPATQYRYLVTYDDRSSDLHTMKTAVDEGTPFRFATYGDNKDGPMEHERVANAILAERPDFVIHNGDLVNTGWVAKQWTLLFFEPTRRMMHSIPLYPVLGNHEEHARLFFDYFSLPGNEAWYSFDYGNAHFVVLDSASEDQLRADSDQIAWLLQDLATSGATWKFVNFHHPPFSSGGFYHASDRIALKNVLHPIFEQHRVDLVFSGHDHNYERMLPIGSAGGEHKVSYVVSGNGGTPLRWVGARGWTAHAQRVFGFVTVDIDGTRLHMVSHALDGDVIDELLIDKADASSYGEYHARFVDFDAIEDPVVATEHFESGDDLFDEDLYEAALAEFLAAYEADPTCIEAVGGIAESLLELGRTGEAIEWALTGIEILPQFTGTYEVLVEAHHEFGDDKTALEWARKWREIAPDSPDAQQAMAQIHADRGELEAAVAALEQARAILPSDYEIHFDLGRLYERQGEVEAALISYVRGLHWFMDEKDQDEEELEEYEKIRQRVLAVTERTPESL